MINHLIDILKADGAVTAITTAARIFPLARLQGSAVPAVVLQLTNTDPVDTHDAVANLDEHIVQVTAIAATPKSCYDLGEVVRLSLDGYIGGDISSCRFITQASDIFEADDLFTITMQFNVHLQRGEVTLPASAAMGSNLNLRGAMYYRVTELALTNGYSYVCTSADYCIFADYATASGSATATLRLPPVASNEGRVIRIKTGKALSNSRVLVVRGNVADDAGIDGSETATMDRDYDGITVMCHKTGWYIIQRKSK
jgi:hypothetical protein